MPPGTRLDQTGEPRLDTDLDKGDDWDLRGAPKLSTLHRVDIETDFRGGWFGDNEDIGELSDRRGPPRRPGSARRREEACAAPHGWFARPGLGRDRSRAERGSPFDEASKMMVESGGMESVGRMLLVMGAVLVLVGALLAFGPRIPGLGRLPGDIVIERDDFRLYLPLGSSLLVSLVLSVLIWLFGRGA